MTQLNAALQHSGSRNLAGWILVCAFGITFAISVTSSAGTGARWPIYGLPVLSVVVWGLRAQGEKLNYDRRFVFALIAYLLAAGFAIASTLAIPYETIRDVLIVSGLFLTFIPYFHVSDRHLQVMLILLAGSLMLQVASGQTSFFEDIDFLGSQGVLESQIAFPAATLALYFLYRRQWLWFLFAVVLAILCFKRISFVGFFVALGFWLVFRLTGRSGTGGRALAFQRTLVIGFLIFACLLSVNFTNVLDFVYQHYKISVSANQLTMGRYDLETHFHEFMAQSGPIHWLFGNGPGTADTYAWEESAHSLSNTHDDFMKLLFEYGWVGETIILIAVYNIYRSHLISLLIFVINIVLMMTDNTWIYFFHQFVCYMIVRALLSDQLDDPDPVYANVRSSLSTR